MVFFSHGCKFYNRIEVANIIMRLNKIHLQLIQIQTKRRNAQGFMLVEVLVGILLTLILTGIAMQVVVMATAVKVKGDEVTDATLWIQQDLEDINKQAGKIDFDGTKYTPTLCATQTSTNGYAANLNGLTNINGTISSNADVSLTSSSGTRSYNLVRTTAVKSELPYNVLTINYSVYKPSATDAHASLILSSYAEVIPSASFYCKKLS
jgi:type II secretory pathway pseudopilin PulG